MYCDRFPPFVNNKNVILPLGKIRLIIYRNCQTHRRREVRLCLRVYVDTQNKKKLSHF